MLEKIVFPKDLKKLKKTQLTKLSSELRNKTIQTVSKTGGHLGAGLGVIELTVALHYVFDTPNDKIIWDVGHQTYPHKIITGRASKIETIRKKNGLSGFTKRSESEYDVFGTGHSSTSISAALGLASARDLKNEHHEVIAIIGDGAFSAGMAYEAINNATEKRTKLIVILNDNKMSIAPAVGAMHKYLTKIVSSKQYLSFRNITKKILIKIPNWLAQIIKKFEKNLKDLFSNSNFFENMGFYYIGPIDGHNVDDLVDIFSNIKNDTTINKPILLHVITEKGKGFSSPQKSVEKYHAMSKFDLETKITKQNNNNPPSFTNIFAKELISLADKNHNIVAITAAMPSGTGLNDFAKKYPQRFFDVGIAEQHAVTFAAGLACGGFKPIVAIYSTFLQRAYDQIVHDVSIQNLPVIFAIDRAGYVGEDGPTHSGSFDISFLINLPNFTIMCPAHEQDLVDMMHTSLTIEGPCAYRYPRGSCFDMDLTNYTPEILKIGKSEIVIDGKDIAILNLGTKLNECIKAAEILKKHNIFPTIINAKFAKPFDAELISNLIKNHNTLIIIEEGSSGGFSSNITEFVNHKKLELRCYAIHYPDCYIDHMTKKEMEDHAGMNSISIAEQIIKFYKI